MAGSQYCAVRQNMQPHPKVPPPVISYQAGVRSPYATLRPKSSRVRAKVLKPDVKQALELMNKEIHLRLKACRGQNRHEHPLLPTLDISREIGPILENPSEPGASSPDRCTAESPTCAEGGGTPRALTEVNWRQRLRSRGWRLPERSWTPRPPPGDKDSNAEALNTTLRLQRKTPLESSSARSANTSTEAQKDELRPVRSTTRVRRRTSSRKTPEDLFWDPTESSDGSNPPSRKISNDEGLRRRAPGTNSQTTQGRVARYRHSQAHRRTSTNDRRLVNTREIESDEEAEEKREPEDSASLSLGLGRLAPDRNGGGQKPQLQALGIEVEIKEVDLAFQVVKWSTQRQESPAADLEKSSGWWESGGGNVEHQFIVLQTQNKEPKMVHALELSLPGNDAGPRACKLQYSCESAEGPWKDAWSFNVASKSDVKCRTTFETGSTLTKDFKEWLKKTYRGNTKEGWKHLFSENDQEIPVENFLVSMGRIKQMMHHPNHPPPAWCSTEAQKLSEDLVPKDGKITLESVLAPCTPPPEAPYWKLNILSNWGSPKRLQVMSPLRMTTLIQVQTGGLSRMRASFIENQAGSLAGDSLIRAFDLETLGVDSEAVQLRRLAKKYGLSILDVEDMHRLFSTTTSDGKVIVQSEFISMLLKLYGTDDISEVPPQRLRFFWQQADQDGSGEIDFEEFIMWYNCYCEEILSRRKIRRRRDSTEEDVRYDLTK